MTQSPLITLIKMFLLSSLFSLYWKAEPAAGSQSAGKWRCEASGES